MIAVIEAVALVVVVLAFLWDRRQTESVWTAERRELLNRVQFPDRMPTEASAEFRLPELEPDEIGLVGTIKYEDEVS
jgi:hypothetical protein